MAREILLALWGAARLARFDASGMAFLDTSLAGFWASFRAAWLVAPLYGLLLLIRFASGEVATDAVRFFVVEASAYVIHWVAWPLVMISGCRLMGREDRYLGYIVAGNWASAVQNLVCLPLIALMLLGTFVSGPGGFVAAFLTLNAVVSILVLVYDWSVARIALRLGGGGAAAVTGAALTLSLFIDAAAKSLLG